MNLHRAARIAHRWLAWAIGLQLLAWLLGGALFAWLPFQDWVKAQAVVTARPVPQTAPEWPATLQQAVQQAAPGVALRGASLVAAADGPIWKLGLADGRTLRLRADGRAWAAPDAAAIERFARTLYKGPGAMLGRAEWLAVVPTRLGIVQELAGRRNVWRVRFDDGLQTRLYFEGEGGEFLTARTEAWVWYDLLWRVHIMDYGGGDDFNNPLLRAAAPLALLLGLAGALLALQTAVYRLRERRRRSAQRDG